MIGQPGQAGDTDTGVPQIEVTPEMVEAGFKVLKASGLADDLLVADKCMVADIYRAMLVLRPSGLASQQHRP